MHKEVQACYVFPINVKCCFRCNERKTDSWPR